MDYEWTPKSSRPSKLYRVYRPFQHTSLSHRGLRASNTTLHLTISKPTHFSLFLDSLISHRTQSALPSPYVSFFSSLTEAESWALAAEDEFLKPAFILEIDVKCRAMENVTLWKVSDIQDKTGEKLGLGGMKNSEWLALFAVPGAVISREFRSSKEIRIKRAIPFPVYVENPNRLTIHDPLWDEKLFQGGWMKNHPLKCGCANEWRCIHFQWPEWTGEEGEDFGGEEVRGLGGDQASGEPNQVSLDSGVDVGTEGIRVPGGHPMRGEEDRNSGDSRVAMGDGGISAARRASLLAKEKQGSVEKVLGNEGIQSPESASPLREEDYSLAKFALEAFRAMSHAAYSGAEIQSNTKMTIEGVQTSGNNSIAAKPKRGTAENPVQIL